ncbi:serine/threonine protein kinase [Archangium lipolyticum]|uniref:serine/threonine protein kinase n=1 Tax=Archangium lipolyticum TaxID=2970465 RepID=UPI00214A01D0|nr:protein kinase [Archangium lipolyticum]
MQQVGKYQLIRKLATGGMAEVFLAKAAGPMGFEKTLVLKRILPHLAEEPAFVQMFLSEAKLAARLTHPHIAQIFDFGEADGAYFLAMEYIDGPSLRTLIKRASAQGLLLPPDMCARLVSHACEGLAFAHDFTDPETGEALDVIHRDISPDNILLSRQGAVKVVDFGIAKAAGHGTRTESGVIKGKLAYMPPEQLRGQALDRRADVYALGVVLYELLTARRPFASSTDAGLMQAILFSTPVPAAQVRPDLPEPLQRILARALSMEREQRYPDCHSFQADLEEFILLAGKPVVTQQIAQLITRATSSTEIPVAQPGTTPHGSRYTTTPVHTPAPTATRTDPEAFSTPVTVKRPEKSSEPLTIPNRPQRLKEPHPLEDLEIRQQEELVKRWRSRRRELTLVACVLLAAGGGIVLWRTAPEPKPQESVPVAENQPSPSLPSVPAPSTDNTGERAQANPSAPSASLHPKNATPQEQKQKPAAPNAIPQDPVTSKNVRPPSRVGSAPKLNRTALASPDPKLNGTLKLRIRPPATVAVDGEELGYTTAPIELSAGPHIVTLVSHTLSKIVQKDIEVEPGKTTILEVNLHQE